MGGPEMRQRLDNLQANWNTLRNAAAGRFGKLGESEQYQQFIGRCDEEEAWMSEKQQVLSVDDYGDNMAGVQGLMHT
jgi:spectrin alpha